MRTNLPALLVVLALFLVSCEKEEAHCDSVSESSPEFLNYWFYPQGSWWVYELQGSPGTIDTVKVVQAEAKFYKPDGYSPRVPCKMVYTQTLSHSDTVHFLPSKYNPNAWEKYEAQGENLFLDRYLNVSRFATEGPIFNLPVQTGRMLHTHIYMGDTADVVTHAQTFEETVEIKNLKLDDSTETNFAKSYYFTKDVGITKRVYSNNQVWILKSYFINK